MHAGALGVRWSCVRSANGSANRVNSVASRVANVSPTTHAYRDRARRGRTHLARQSVAKTATARRVRLAWRVHINPHLMAHIDPLLAQRPELADTLPDVLSLANATPAALAANAPLKPSFARAAALPFLLGAGVGAAAVLALRRQKQPLFTLFPVSKSILLSRVVKIVVLGVGRALLRRAFSRAAARAGLQVA